MVDTGLDIGANFLTNVLNGVETFITVTRFDTVVWSPAIADGLSDGNFNQYLSENDGAKYRSDLPAGSRPGGMSIKFNDLYSSVEKTIRMPTYISGHTVTMRAPAELLADVMQWYSSLPP
jgi:hypothetical protein